MDFAELKLIHQITASISIVGFILRGVAVLLNASWPRSRLARVLPHINDTVLLFSAVALAWQLRITPFNTNWLLVKIVGLILYILLGIIALRTGKSRQIKALAGCCALLVFAFIASVAISKSPWGYFSSLLNYSLF